jgi:hypothetical protein
MDEQDLRARLARTLHTRITEPEWRRLKKIGLVGEYQRDLLSWEEFRDLARRDLDQIRAYAEDLRREQAGELPLEIEISETTPELASEVDISAPLSERTAARAQALVALDNYCLGPANPDRVGSRTISSRVRPQGGFDKTLPHWVIELKIEAWVPAEDVRSIYHHVQRDLLAEESYPKVRPRTFRVAQFVWEEELRCGKRPSWPVLLERWKECNPDDDRFKDWRAFRTCFKRGEEATPPRYAEQNDYIASEAKRLRQLKEAWEEGPRFGIQPF